MITDVPTSDDFQQAGIGFLNLAWDAAYELVRDSRSFQEWDHWGEEEQQYWNSAQRPLATALALAPASKGKNRRSQPVLAAGR